MRYKTKTLISIFFISILAGVSTFAQQQNDQPKVYEITAKEAVDIAFKNVADLKNAKLDYKIAEARNKEVTGMALPQASGSLQGNHYLSLPQIQFPDATELAIYDVLKREGVKDATGNPITKDGEFAIRNFSFFTPWNVNAGISVNQLLFEPQVFVGLQARKTLLESSDLQIKVAEDKVRETVYKSYYAVLISQKQLGYLQESITRLEKLSSDMSEMFKQGFVEKLDIDKATVSLNNTRTIELQLQNAVKIGFAVLKMNLGLPQSDSLVLKDALPADYIKEGILEDNFKYEDRNEIKLLNTAVKLQGYDMRRYKLSYYPTVAAFYNFQRTGQRRAAENGQNQPWFWYSTNLIGLNVNIPIFDGFQKKYKIRQSQFTLEKVQNTLDQTKKGIDLERTVAKNTLTNAILTMDSQEKNMELAQNVYNTVKKKYEQGLGSSFEILQADTDFQQAQSNYFKALYDAIVAKIGYQKALGKL
ncbi:MAG TPA: TolC family protein [Chitinophagaceae bacterium]|nr:TolC family protein [Chitinophagaceae bacterium]